ncbi:MAG: multicopper oxidase family protein [Pseudomonadota bacterium]
MPNLTRRQFTSCLAATPLAFAGPGLSFADDGFVTLTARPTNAQLLAPGEKTTHVWAYGQSVPGPVLRVRQGERLKVRFVNDLPMPSTIHWHGIRIENAMDGVAGLTQQPVPPGESFDYAFTAPDAGTYWYHPHFRTFEQLARGLYGVLIVEEPAPPGFDADLPLAIDDWRLTEDGAIHEASLGAMMDKSHAGRLGNWITVNGASGPTLKLPTNGMVRLRLVNTSNARVLRLKIGPLAAKVIALDGQPLAEPQEGVDVLTLAPAQRADIALRAPGEPDSKRELLALAGGDQEISIATLQTSGPAVNPRPMPQLSANPIPRLSQFQDALRVDLRMAGGAMGTMSEATYKGQVLTIRELVRAGQAWSFNGISGRTEDPLFKARRGQTVLVSMVNDTSWPHAMHFHGHHVQVIEKNGQKVQNAPWRDTVLMERQDAVKVAFPAENVGKWMIHCHMLEHQAAGMATWFAVV